MRWVVLVGMAIVVPAIVVGSKALLVVGLGGLVFPVGGYGWAFINEHASSGETELTELRGRPRPSSS